MFRNYFYLYRFTRELNASLKGRAVKEAFTQEKDCLALHVPLEQNPDYHLILNCNSNLSCIIPRERFNKSKKNTINFFNEYLPDKIISLQIAPDDRAVKIELENSELFFLIQGGNTNVHFKNSDKYISFKRPGEKDSPLPVKFINSSLDYPYARLNIENTELLEWKYFQKQFPYMGKDIFLESLRLTGSDSVKELKENLIKCIHAILFDEIAVFYDDMGCKSRLMPKSFLKDDTSCEKSRFFDNYSEAVNYYITLKYKFEKDNSLKLRIGKYLDSEINKLSAKLNNLKFRIDEGSKEKEYKETGNLLLANIYNIPRGCDKVELSDYNTGDNKIIELDKKLSVQKNIDRYFDKSKDEKVNYAHSVELYNSALIRLDKLNSIRMKLNSDISIDELNDINKKIKTGGTSGKSKMEEKINFKHYILHDKYDVFVGKDSKNNDELTTQFAKQNDLWFHARGLPGSHVVLRITNTKEAVPKNIIKETASIAAYFSKAKTAGMVPVSYTFRKYVHKKKGLDPGQVILDREDVVLVKPEIPKGCEPVFTENI